jgi:hypothetical protein
MSRRIDVELTSARDDGTWTWRAAGAREPKGVVGNDVLYPGAKVGDVVRAEADFDIDGITLLSVTPPRAKAQAANVIEVTGTGGAFEPVTTSWVPKSERPRTPGRDRGDRGPRGDRPDRPAGDRGPRPSRDNARGGAPAGPRRDARPERPPREPRPDRPARAEREPAAAAKPRPKRLNPSNKHRAAVLESLSPEQRPVAEQVLRGGLPAVRRALEEQNASLKAAGQPEIKPGPLVAMAEDLLPRLKTAEWHDRAEAALTDVEDIGLRDLRSVVSGADAAARDEETRGLAVQLREALERRLKQQHDQWVGEISTALEEGRLVRALRVAARPPDPTMRFPAELALRLSGTASESMAADTPPERWAALLEAVAASPVRTTVKPASLPNDAPEALLHNARQLAGRIPALTQLLGISMPPPPGPVRRIPPKPTQPPPTP